VPSLRASRTSTSMRVDASSGKRTAWPARPPSIRMRQRCTAVPAAKLLCSGVSTRVPGGNSGRTLSVVCSSSAGNFQSTS